jgi:erythromycin esterase-like protein
MLRTKRSPAEPDISALLGRSVHPLRGEKHDYDALLDLIGDARCVLIGEASHGTHEFYQERALLTQRLIEEREFAGVCIEGDWPDAYRVDCFVKGDGNDADADAALRGFRRFPSWMWRNEVVRDFIGWLRAFNDAHPGTKAGFYGMDLYSLFGSIQAILAYLDRVDPDAGHRARHRYSCFEHFDQDSQVYGYATASDLAEPCEEEAIHQLMDIRANAVEYVGRDGLRSIDDLFSAEQNARLVQNAEQYYRAMYRGRASTWNLRDRHMAETLESVERHLAATGRAPKLVVWAHNSHLGDARFTDMRRRGEINLGQLARERYGDAVRIVGFTGNTGTVTAAHDWDEPGRRMSLRPALEGSHERILADFAATRAMPRFYLLFREAPALAERLAVPRLQRAVGVIYRPETERVSHYYDVELSRQFDAVIHLDETRALRALDPGEPWLRGEEPPETYPSGI